MFLDQLGHEYLVAGASDGELGGDPLDLPEVVGPVVAQEIVDQRGAQLRRQLQIQAH